MFARSVRERRAWRPPLLGLLVVVVVALTACQPTQVTPDNKVIKLVGVPNGVLPAGQLTGVSSTCAVYREAAASFRAMVAAAQRDGVQLSGGECYRDLPGQEAARASWCARGACHMAAIPGTSNHGWGKAVDFRDQAGSLTWDSRGYRWMKDNAGRFGWNHHQEFEPDGASPEAWHWEWIGDGGTRFPGQYFGEGTVSPLAPGRSTGSLDHVTAARTVNPSTVRIRGWVIDPESQASIDVHVYIDGAGIGGAKANKTRSDVASAFPAWQTHPHGFDFAMPIGHGTHEVCVFAINAAGPGDNPVLGCRMITIDRAPFGVLDSASVVDSRLTVRGWALDADTTAAIDVHTYLNGQILGSTKAGTNRPDLAGVVGGLGTAHGFDASYEVGTRRGTVCNYGINVATGSNTQLGCTTI